LFRALWISDVVSSIGTWMHDSAAAWLMTLLTPSPLMVSLVQVATTLPLFVLALPRCPVRHPGPAARFARDSGVAGPDGRLAGRTHGTGVVQPWMLSWSRSPLVREARSTSRVAGDDS